MNTSMGPAMGPGAHLARWPASVSFISFSICFFDSVCLCFRSNPNLFLKIILLLTCTNSFLFNSKILLVC